MSLVDSSEAIGKLDFPSAAWAICEAAKTAFKAKVVWIGLVTPDSTDVVPVASAGDETGYIRQVKARWDESPHAKGPTHPGASPRCGPESSTSPRSRSCMRTPSAGP